MAATTLHFSLAGRDDGLRTAEPLDRHHPVGGPREREVVNLLGPVTITGIDRGGIARCARRTENNLPPLASALGSQPKPGAWLPSLRPNRNAASAAMAAPAPL